MAKLHTLQPISISFEIEITVPVAIDLDDIDNSTKRMLAQVRAQIREAVGNIAASLDNVYDLPTWPG